jgi:hypothetical protein
MSDDRPGSAPLGRLRLVNRRRHHTRIQTAVKTNRRIFLHGAEGEIVVVLACARAGACAVFTNSCINTTTSFNF